MTSTSLSEVISLVKLLCLFGVLIVAVDYCLLVGVFSFTFYFTASGAKCIISYTTTLS